MQTDTERHRPIERDTHTGRYRETDTERHKQMDKEIQRDIDRCYTNTERYRQI